MNWTALIASLLIATNAAPTSTVDVSDTEVFESLRDVPQGWQSVGVPDANARMRFRMALRMVSSLASRTGKWFHCERNAACPHVIDFVRPANALMSCKTTNLN